MIMISEQANELRELATDTEYDREELKNALKQAADTIESLSRNLAMANTYLIDGNGDGYVLSKIIAELDKRICERLKIIPRIADETLNHGYLKSIEAYQQAKLIVEDNFKECTYTHSENAWTYCDDKMPPKPKNNPILENKPLELYLVVTGEEEYPFRAFWNGENFTDGFQKLENVMAWMPLSKFPKQNKQKQEGKR